MNEILSAFSFSDFVAFWLLLFVPSFVVWMILSERAESNRYAARMNAARERAFAYECEQSKICRQSI